MNSRVGIFLSLLTLVHCCYQEERAINIDPVDEDSDGLILPKLSRNLQWTQEKPNDGQSGRIGGSSTVGGSVVGGKA